VLILIIVHYYPSLVNFQKKLRCVDMFRPHCNLVILCYMELLSYCTFGLIPNGKILISSEFFMLYSALIKCSDAVNTEQSCGLFRS